MPILQNVYDEANGFASCESKQSLDINENASPPLLMIVLPPSLAAGLAVRYSSRVVRSPAAHAPGVRSGRSCHTQPTRVYGKVILDNWG